MKKRERFSPQRAAMDLFLHAILSLQVLVTDATAEAVAAVAVLLLQLDEGLAIGSILHEYATILPTTDDIVVLSFQLLK